MEIGSGLPRPDAWGKVRGSTRYVDDLAFPGMVHLAVVRSEWPHARISGIHVQTATQHPLVVCAVAAADVPGENVVHVVYDDQPVLAAEIVRYVGEPIAVIAAESRRVAKQAARLVEIDHEPLPAITDPLAALAADAPRVGLPYASEDGNLFNAMRLRNGNVEKGFSEADVIVESEYRTGYQEHAYLEPQGVIAVPEENGGLAIYGSMQCPFYVQAAVARVLGLPMAKVRVIQTATGGAFGGKEDFPSLLGALAAVAAWKTERPAKLILDRDEDVLVSTKRHPAIVRYKSGAKADGTLTAIEVDFVYNAGAYQTLSSAVLWRGLVTAAGPYRIPHVKIDGKSVATHTVPNGAFRGFGSPQVIFPHESQMDRIAERLGIDRLEIRRRNALRPDDASATGQQLDESTGIVETLDRAERLSDWSDRLRAVEAFNASSPHVRRGVGVASVMYGVGLGGKAPFLDKAGAYLKLEADGSVSAAVGTVEMGQGLTVALTQILAHALDLPIDRIQLAPVDSSRVPDSGPTVASRGTIMSGCALLDAATKLKARIVDVAKSEGITLDEIPRRLPEIAHAFWMQNLDPAVEGWSASPDVDWDPETGLGNAYATYAYATHVAQVEIDLITGEAAVHDYVAVHDSGRILNRQSATGQVEGGIAQGIGFALTEEIQEKDGRLLANGLTSYRVPTIRDAARPMTVDFVETTYRHGPFGAKGLGEVPLMASHAAVARAVAHALGCPGLDTYPLSPERIVAAARASDQR